MFDTTDMAQCAAQLHYHLDAREIPYHMHAGIADYVLHGRAIGDFLTAVFSNDLMDAAVRADDTNRRVLANFGGLLCDLPYGSYGSKNHVKLWRAHCGFSKYAERSSKREQLILDEELPQGWHP